MGMGGVEMVGGTMGAKGEEILRGVWEGEVRGRINLHFFFVISLFVTVL